MRIYQTSDLTFSEDDSTSPSNIIYQDSGRSVTDVTHAEGTSGFQTFAPSAADVSIPLGNIAAAKWLYIIPSAEISIKLDAGSALILAANKPTSMWVDFAAISVSNADAGASVNVSWAIAGD